MQTRSLPGIGQVDQDQLRQIANVAAIIVVIVVNALANALPIGGKNTGELSDQYLVLFTPAGYVFSIWGLIYLSLIGFAVYQALPAQRDNPRLQRVGYMFVYSCGFNVAWIFAWHYEVVWLSLLLMFGILATLITIYERIGTGKTPAPSKREFWLLRAPFSLYLGWITVATVANVSVFFYVLGWTGANGSAAWWTVVAIIAALAVVSAVVATRRDAIFTGVFVWAAIGIAVRNWDLLLVANSALIAVVVALAVIGLELLEPPPSSSSTPSQT